MKEQFVEKFERKVIAAALEQAKGNVSQAARLLKIKRQNLQVKLKALGISPTELRRK
ncbi:MAG: hypothetical protein ONB24_04690 [candidate division KSB1 bacterium]|nr:hypothetical protein [candidate division KSB1 bacterium]